MARKLDDVMAALPASRWSNLARRVTVAVFSARNPCPNEGINAIAAQAVVGMKTRPGSC